MAVSPSAARYIQRWGVPEKRIHLVPNGVPRPTNLADRTPPQGTWTIGTIALFRPRKGLEVLLEALAVLHRRGLNVKLRAVGRFETPDYEQQIICLAEKLNVTNFVEWRGFQRDIDAELAALDLMILPSVLPEGMPMVVLEAMAAGVPPIGSAVEGISDVIEHGFSGLLSPSGDSTALADTIQSIISGQHDWQTLRRSALAAHATQYSDQKMAAAVADIYRTILSR